MIDIKNKISWYFYRLQVMGIYEILYRIYKVFLNIFLKENTLNHVNNFDLSKLPFNSGFIDNLSLEETKYNDIIDEANDILKYKIKIFNKYHQFNNPINFHLDFVDNKSWPKIKSSKINYRSYQNLDPKYIWELNRHNFLINLGLAYQITKNDKYSKMIIDTISSWIDQNPFNVGINWTSCIELSIRQINWLYSIKLIEDSTLLNNEFLKKLSNNIFNQTNLVSKNLSLYSSANNHLISECTILILSGSLFNKKSWVRKGKKYLEKEIYNQINDDGSGAEQSNSYLLHTLEFYLLSVLTLNKNKQDVSLDIINRLIKSANFINSFNFNPNCLWGDNDSGEILSIYGEDNSNSIVSLILSITNENFLYNKKDIKLNLLNDDITPYHKMTRLENKFKFEDGGHYILENKINNKDVKLVIHSGDLGLPPLNAHGHDDALSITLYVDNNPILIDPGTYTYFGDIKWRNYFKSTASHNTLRINEIEQSFKKGRFLGKTNITTSVNSFVPKDSFSGEINYRNVQIRHKRDININHKLNSIDIVDKIDSNLKSNLRIEHFFHFHDSVSIENNNNMYILNYKNNIINFLIDDCTKNELFYGDEITPFGWSSNVYGEKKKIFAIKSFSESRNNKVFLTRIVIK